MHIVREKAVFVDHVSVKKPIFSRTQLFGHLRKKLVFLARYEKIYDAKIRLHTSSQGCNTPACVRHCIRFIFSSHSSSAILFLPRYLNCLSINLDVGMFAQSLVSARCLVPSKVHSHLHCQNPANSPVRGFYWYSYAG